MRRPPERLPIVAAIAGMLHGEEHALHVVEDERAAELGADRYAVEELRGRPRLTLGVDRPEAVGAAGVAGVLPSVETHRRPSASMAQLSGMPNQPSLPVAVEKVAPTDGSPHC